MEDFFFFEKFVFFYFVLKTKTISPLKRELSFFEKILFYFFQKIMFFLSLFFVFSDTFFLVFFLVRILRGFWSIQKKTKKVSEKNKKKWQKKHNFLGKIKQYFFKKTKFSFKGGGIFCFQKKMKKNNIFQKKKSLLNCPFKKTDTYSFAHKKQLVGGPPPHGSNFLLNFRLKRKTKKSCYVKSSAPLCLFLVWSWWKK